MIIRPEQMQAFAAVAEKAFVARVVEYLRQKHGAVGVHLPSGIATVGQIPQRTLQKMVENGIARARGYGMNYESALAAFIVILFEAAPNFDDHPLIQRILKDESVPPNSRIEELLSRATEQNWEAIKQHYNPDAWGLGREEGTSEWTS